MAEQSEALKRARHAALGIFEPKFKTFEHNGVVFALRKPNLRISKKLSKAEGLDVVATIAMECLHVAMAIPGTEPVKYQLGELVFTPEDRERIEDFDLDEDSLLGRASTALKDLNDKSAAAAKEEAKNS